MRSLRWRRRFSAESCTSVSQKSKVTALSMALLELRPALLEEGEGCLAGLARGVALGEGVDAEADGRGEIRVSRPHDQLVLEADGAWRAREDRLRHLRRHALDLVRPGGSVG